MDEHSYSPKDETEYDHRPLRRESKDDEYRNEEEQHEKKRLAEDDAPQDAHPPPDKQIRKEESDDREAKRTVYFGNLNFQTDRNFLERELSKFGEIKDILIPLDDNGRRRGFAFVTFTDDHAAHECTKELDDQEFDGRRIRCNIARPRTGGGSRRGPERYGERQRDHRRPRSGRIIVSGLPDDIRERELDDLYYRCGRIAYIEIFRNRGRLEAIVAFDDIRDAEYACRQTDGMRFEKQRLRVDLDN
uniref:RRM domain-containing protein n=1 Tax=Aureoumbra lagunensis TaxID=44058 RepID=A0A7S3NN27_9STRA